MGTRMQCAVADHGTLGMGRQVLVLGSNGETNRADHVQHDMDVGAAVAHKTMHQARS